MRILVFVVFSQIIFSFSISSCREKKSVSEGAIDLGSGEKDLSLAEDANAATVIEDKASTKETTKASDPKTETITLYKSSADSNDTAADTDSAEPLILTTYYVDHDGDGFGDPNDSVDLNAQADGYVTDNTDCDDNDPLLNPNSSWYEDMDKDTFGDSAGEIKFTQCLDPTTSKRTYVLNNSDCDDTTESVKDSNEIWYEDLDEDGFGDPNSAMTSCTDPDGYVSNADDKCPSHQDANNLDTDEDGWCDSEDTCPYGSPKLLVTGKISNYDYISYLYEFRSDGTVKIADQSTFTGAYVGAVAAADFDQDGDTDLLLTGKYSGDGSSDTLLSELYLNEGGGSFQAETFDGTDETTLVPVSAPTLIVSDFDQDSFKDLLVFGYAISGYSNSVNYRMAEVFLNDGNGNFYLSGDALGPEESESNRGSGVSLDLDGDGDLDFVISGCGHMDSNKCIDDSDKNMAIFYTYLNDGDGTFTLKQADLDGIYDSTVLSSDFDGDGDLDIFAVGELTYDGAGYTYSADLYLNDGTGYLTAQDSDVFIGTASVVSQQAVASDFDGDGATDLFVTGDNANETQEQRADFYYNDGSASFTHDPDSGLPGLGSEPAVTSFDLFNDGFEDLFISGEDADGNFRTEIYKNNGDRTYTLLDSSATDGTALIGVSKGSLTVFCD